MQYIFVVLNYWLFILNMLIEQCVSLINLYEKPCTWYCQHQTVITNMIADDKPAVVVTHGDRLSFQQRSYVKNELAETLAIPLQQIFDISGIASLLSSCSYYP